MNNKKKVAILLTRDMAESIFGLDINKSDLKLLAEIADFNDPAELPDKMTQDIMLELIKDADACVSCWGTPPFTAEMLDAAPNLKLIAHGAGSVKALLPSELWPTITQRGIRVTSNAPMIAKDVAQTVLALMLTSLLQLWGNAAGTKKGGWKGGESGSFTTKKINGLDIGLIGLSYVCREVIAILKPFDVNIKVWDPYACELEARKLGVTLTSLEDLLSTCDVVSVHAPANEDCRHILNAANLPLMRDGTLFINTARGMIVDEPALIKELETGRIFACIDVTDPEPPRADHPFRTLDNVVLTSHVAGGHTSNGRRMLGANTILQLCNYLTKGFVEYVVREEQLEHMA